MRWLALFIVLLFSAQTGMSRLAGQMNPAAEEHVRQVLEALPAETPLHRRLETGARGDGIHQGWMDKMRELGVRRALVRTEFEWHGRPTHVRVGKLVYFSKYDSDCAQISDPQRLAQIRASGVEEELGKAAAERTLRAHWLLIHERHRTSHGVGTIELLDDEWLPRLPDILAPAPKTPSPFREAIDMDDVAAARSLLQADVKPEQRDGALWATLSKDDSCMARALLEAGADPNLQDRDGFTPLMLAVRYRAYRNVRVLLAAGAKVGAKAHNGQTAVSFAELEHDGEMIELLKRSGASK